MRLAIFCFLMAAASMAASKVAPLYKATDDNRIAGSYIVVFQENIDLTAAKEDVERQLLSRFIPMGTIRREYRHVLNGIAGAFSKEAIEIIRRLPLVKYVEESQIVRTMQNSDPVASWGLDRVDDRDLTDCDGFYTPHYNGTGVWVYVIDTGVLTSHTDFGGRAYPGEDFVTPGGDAEDCNGHGTHCSGTVAGKLYGVAKNASIIGVRVLGCLGFGSSEDVLAGMEYALYDSVETNKLAVVSMSLGGGASAADDEAVANLVAANVVVSVAAGNDNGDACNYSPARAAEAISVGATDDGDNIASFSNYGMCVDIFAPGVSITSAYIGGNDNDRTATISGTSMACPHVSGAAALLREQNPDADANVIRSSLLEHSTANCVKGLTDRKVYTPNSLLHVHKKNEM